MMTEYQSGEAEERIVYDERYNHYNFERGLDDVFLRIEQEKETAEIRLAEMYHDSDFVTYSMLFSFLSVFCISTFMIFKLLRESFLDYS